MKNIYTTFLIGSLLVLTIGCKSQQPNSSDVFVPEKEEETKQTSKYENNYQGDKVVKTAEEWSAILDKNEYRILREKGTERAFTGDLDGNKESGEYICRGCNLPLFSSNAKFDSGTGWPSFFQPSESTHVATDTDYILGYARTEILCARCDGHLGHVFEDGPKPTGLRYCVNAASLDFVQKP